MINYFSNNYHLNIVSINIVSINIVSIIIVSMIEEPEQEQQDTNAKINEIEYIEDKCNALTDLMGHIESLSANKDISKSVSEDIIQDNKIILQEIERLRDYRGRKKAVEK